MNRRAFFGLVPSAAAIPLIPAASIAVVSAPTKDKHMVQFTAQINDGKQIVLCIDGKALARAVVKDLPEVLMLHGVR